MRKLLLPALLIISATAFAQQKPAANTTKTTTSKPTTAKTQTVTAGAAKDSMLCKPWKLSGVEEFSVKATPTEAQKNDAATFMLETKIAFVTINGKQVTGTWELDKGKTWLTVTEDGTSQKWKYKIVKLAKDELVVEYQNPEDLIRTLYYFEPGKKDKK
jgi:hypothetical protein